MSMENIDLADYFPQVAFGPDVQVCGIRNIAIEPGACIGKDVWLNVCVRDGINMKIGKCVLVGRRSQINTGSYLEIGAYTIIGPNVYVGNVDHDFGNINVPILAGGITDGSSIIVEENCWLGFNAVAIGDITIGRGSVVGANSVVTRDVPPFSVVVGSPAKVVKMYDFSTGSWVPVRSREDEERISAGREKAGMPSREEYLATLSASGFTEIGSLAAGGANHIL